MKAGSFFTSSAKIVSKEKANLKFEAPRLMTSDSSIAFYWVILLMTGFVLLMTFNAFSELNDKMIRNKRSAMKPPAVVFMLSWPSREKLGILCPNRSTLVSEFAMCHFGLAPLSRFLENPGISKF